MYSLSPYCKRLRSPGIDSEESIPVTRTGIFKQSKGARNRVGIGLSYRPARLHRLAEFILCRWGFFFSEPSAAGGYSWLPAPLGWKLANAGNTKTVQNNRNWAKLLLHDVYFIRSKDPQIHNNHGCKTTINWFRRTCNKSKITLLAIYNVHNAIYRSTDCTFFSFFLLLFSLVWNLLVSLTMKTRQINAPKRPAKISCRGNLLDSPARITPRIYSPEKSAISTRGLLAGDPPFPAQNPQARPGPPSLPPPNSSANGARGRG